MFLYNKKGDKAYAEKEQVEILLENGWSKTPPKNVKKSDPPETDVKDETMEDEEESTEESEETEETDESDESEESPTETSAPTASKKIGKKTIQKKK